MFLSEWLRLLPVDITQFVTQLITYYRIPHFDALTELQFVLFKSKVMTHPIEARRQERQRVHRFGVRAY